MYVSSELKIFLLYFYADKRCKQNHLKSELFKSKTTDFGCVHILCKDVWFDKYRNVQNRAQCAVSASEKRHLNANHQSLKCNYIAE